VKIAEMVGYDSVVQLARRSGLNMAINATPSIALGAYEVTPYEIAGAYTVFSNGGTWVKPHNVKSIRDDRVEVIYDYRPTTRPALDARVAYLMTNLMEEVVRSGTGAGVRARGFVLPAAGKTGTSHDGWFAGFTTKLICVVWVGFDDNQELNLEGAQSALPIWAEFMKRAHQYREYSGARYFDAPDGIVSVEVDPLSGQLAGPACPNTRSEVFINGTQPQELCRLHGGGATRVASWDVDSQEPAPAVTPRQAPKRVAQAEPAVVVPDRPSPPADSRPKGFFGRIRDMLK
jgi:penicillin-binding protein 1B